MTILRSREIQPFQSPSKTLRNRIIEPGTPAISYEMPTSQLCSVDTGSSISSDPIPSNNKGSGSSLESALGASLRRSLRLSLKSNSVEGNDIVSESSSGGGRRKRKIVNGENMNEVEVESVDKIEDKAAMVDVNNDLGADKVRVFDLGADNVGVLEETCSGKEIGETMTAYKAKGKRKLGIDTSLTNLDLVDEDDNGANHLRSGKKVAKRRVDERVEIESCKLTCEKEEERGHEEAVAMLINENQNLDLNAVGKTESRLSSEDNGKAKVVEDCLLINEVDQVEMVDINLSIEGTVMDIRRFSRLEKGKAKMVENDLISNMNVTMGSDFKSEWNNVIKKGLEIMENGVLEEDAIHAPEPNPLVNDLNAPDPMERFKNVAKRNASRFAHFVPKEDSEDEIGPSIDDEEDMEPLPEPNADVQDWPGPFSTAMKIIEDRVAKPNVQQETPSSQKIKVPDLLWVPKKNEEFRRSNRLPPSLQDKCMEILAKHADAIVSLDNVPDVLRHKLCQSLCDSRGMSLHVLNLLVCGSPTEVRIKDCSWLTEEDFAKSFEECNTNNLMVLQLDQCGRCMPDYVVRTSLAQSPNSLPVLTTISLKGGCRLSDAGLISLVRSAPSLRSINFSQCSLLTFAGIQTLADALGSSLKELYLDDCQGIDPMLALPAFKKFEHLEVLSLAGLQTVSDKFIRKLMAVSGRNMKELVLTDCV